MTSEIENVTKDGTSFERKTDADKAILVSSANLIAGPDGIVPLSNQSAMILPTSIPATDGEEEVEEFDLGTSVAPGPGVAGEPAQAEVNETISGNPVETANPNSLGEVDITSIIPDIPLVTDKEEEEQDGETKENVDEVPAPVVDEKVVGDEPKGVNEALFVNGPTLITPDPSRFENVVNETSLDSLDLGVNTEEEPKEGEEQELPAADVVVGEAKETESQEEEKPADLGETITLVGAAPAPATVTSDTATEVKENVEEVSKDVEEVKEEVAFVGTTEEAKEDAAEKDEVVAEDKDNKLDIIINKLSDIDDKLNGIKVALEAPKENMDLGALDKAANEIHTSDLPQPLVSAQEEQEEMVDALSQLGDNQNQEIDEEPDETPMFGGGGMFIN